jgi:hypothetical protein
MHGYHQNNQIVNPQSGTGLWKLRIELRKCNKHDCIPKLLLGITIFRIFLQRYKQNKHLQLSQVCHFITISDKLTNLVEVEDEIQLTILACSQHSTKHLNKMQIKLSYARKSTWSLEMVMGQSIRNYKDPSWSAQFGFKEGLKR